MSVSTRVKGGHSLSPPYQRSRGPSFVSSEFSLENEVFKPIFSTAQNRGKSVRAMIAAIAERYFFVCLGLRVRYHCGHCQIIFAFAVCRGLRVARARSVRSPLYHCGHCRCFFVFVFVVCFGLRMQCPRSLRPLPNYVCLCVLQVSTCYTPPHFSDSLRTAVKCSFMKTGCAKVYSAAAAAR